MPRRRTSKNTSKTAKAYDHKETEAILRPDIGIQAQFKKKKEPAKYRYDRSLDPLNYFRPNELHGLSIR